jgi:paraquat-inducible protein B
MLAGGVTFGVPEGEAPGKAVKDGATFLLHRDEDAARNATFNPTLRILLLFDQTVRGLSKRAPVEFRGIPIGRVADISFDLVPSNRDPRIPVLIEIDPQLMRREQRENPEMLQEMDFIREVVGKGLRASLKTGSLITGALYVDLDYYEDAPPAEPGKSGEYLTVPTISSGFAQLEAKITAILDKLESLPLEQAVADIAATAAEAKSVVGEARPALAEIQAAAAAARGTLENPALKELPNDLRKSITALEKAASSVGPDGAVQGDLLRSLDELRASLRSLRALTSTIDEKPNSLLFGRESSGNPTPKAPPGGR